jgi:hypothetical protein
MTEPAERYLKMLDYARQLSFEGRSDEQAEVEDALDALWCRLTSAERASVEERVGVVFRG